MSSKDLPITFLHHFTDEQMRERLYNAGSHAGAQPLVANLTADSLATLWSPCWLNWSSRFSVVYLPKMVDQLRRLGYNESTSRFIRESVLIIRISREKRYNVGVVGAINALRVALGEGWYKPL